MYTRISDTNSNQSNVIVIIVLQVCTLMIVTASHDPCSSQKCVSVLRHLQPTQTYGIYFKHSQLAC